jgi:hypothetical protein
MLQDSPKTGTGNLLKAHKILLIKSNFVLLQVKYKNITKYEKYRISSVKSAFGSIGYEGNDTSAISKEFSDYLLAAKQDIEQDKNILHFADNEEGYKYLEGLIFSSFPLFIAYSLINFPV